MIQDHVWVTDDEAFEFQLLKPSARDNAFSLLLLADNELTGGAEPEGDTITLPLATSVQELDEIIAILQKVRAVVSSDTFDASKLQDPDVSGPGDEDDDGEEEDEEADDVDEGDDGEEESE